MKNGYLACLIDSHVYIFNTDDGTFKNDFSIGSFKFFLPNGNIVTYDGNNVNIIDKNDLSFISNVYIQEFLTILKNGYYAGTNPSDLIRIYDDKGSLKKTIVAQSSVYSLVELKNGLLAGGVSDNSIKIWNVTDVLLKKQLTGNNGIAYILLVLRNGYLASTSTDNTIKIWNTDTGLLLKTLKEPGSIDRIFQLPNNDYLYSNVVSKLRIWNTDTGSLVKSIDISSNFAFVYLKNGYLATGSSGKIQIWN